MIVLVVAAALAIIGFAVIEISGENQILLTDHLEEFDRLAELAYNAEAEHAEENPTWLRGSSIAPEEAKDLITRLRLNAVGVEPRSWTFFAIRGGAFKTKSDYYILSSDTTSRDTINAIAASRLGGWWYESDTR